MFGEIGVIFNIPQPFTVRTKRLSQVIRISHHNFKQLLQPFNEDAKMILSNFLKHLKGLRKDELEEIPLVTELLGDLCTEGTALGKSENSTADEEARRNSTGYNFSKTLPTRVIIHGYHPDDKQNEENPGKLIHLPDTIEDLLRLAEKRLGKRTTILMADGSRVEDSNT